MRLRLCVLVSPGQKGTSRLETTADVLIIGAGASGAALAWSLAETRMNIV